MTAPHLLQGRRAETYARKWLGARGLVHVCSNFSCRLGELDLVMREGDCLVIVEVRYRKSNAYGGSLESVSAAKQRRIALATQRFLQLNRDFGHLSLRFDILALSGPPHSVSADWRKAALQFDT